eukprot:31394-Pelagococcus_subviridis.AAC.7
MAKKGGSMRDRTLKGEGGRAGHVFIFATFYLFGREGCERESVGEETNEGTRKDRPGLHLITS